MGISNLNQLRSTWANLPWSSGSANVERLKTHYKAPPWGGGTSQQTLQFYARPAVQASDAYHIASPAMAPAASGMLGSEVRRATSMVS